MIKIEVNTENVNGAYRAVKVTGHINGKGKDLIPETVTVLQTLEKELGRELFNEVLHDWVTDACKEVAKFDINKGADNDLSNE